MPLPAAPLETRLLARRRVTEDGCWIWTGPLVRNGYAEISLPGNRRAYVHRVAYELWVSPIPAGLQLDHLCHSSADCPGICGHRACFNPAHLEPVTPRENNRRSRSASAIHSQKTACPAGHPYDYVTPDGRRRCRTCDNAKRNERRQRAATRCPSADSATDAGPSRTRATRAATRSPAPCAAAQAPSEREVSPADE